MKKISLFLNIIIILILGIFYSIILYLPIEPYTPTPEGYTCLGACSYDDWLSNYKFVMYLRKTTPIIITLFIIFFILIIIFIYKSELNNNGNNKT